MTLFALRQRVALALCPELGRALTKARSDVARLNWLVEERAKLIEHRSRQAGLQGKAVGVFDVCEAFEAGDEAPVGPAGFPCEGDCSSEKPGFEHVAAGFEQGDAVFDGHYHPVLPVVGATDGNGSPGPGKEQPAEGRGMENEPYNNLLKLCDAYSQHTNTSHWRVSFLARGDGQFFKRLRQGGGCTVKTEKAVLGWFSDNWPADLEWPRDIARPAAKRRVA